MTALPDPPAKWLCEECGEVTLTPLRAPNPFDPDDEVSGCPSCREVNRLVMACQVEGCDMLATGGHPNAYGFRYIWTCWAHSPKNPTKKALEAQS